MYLVENHATFTQKSQKNSNKAQNQFLKCIKWFYHSKAKFLSKFIKMDKFYFRASDPGGLANPGFTEEPPPDYSSAVASTQV